MTYREVCTSEESPIGLGLVFNSILVNSTLVPSWAETIPCVDASPRRRVDASTRPCVDASTRRLVDAYVGYGPNEGMISGRGESRQQTRWKE